MNRTLVERVRCLLSQAQLPRSFWGEALNTVVYVLPLTPCGPLQFDVPNRVWIGKDVSYDHLGIFCCKAFVYIPKDERSKLNVKTRQCIFAGYGMDEFDYRFYDSVEKKLVRNRDVVFMEDQTIQDVEKIEKGVHQYSDDLIDLDLVSLSVQMEHNVQDDQQGSDDVDALMQVKTDHQTTDQLPELEIPLRRSTRN